MFWKLVLLTLLFLLISYKLSSLVLKKLNLKGLIKQNKIKISIIFLITWIISHTVVDNIKLNNTMSIYIKYIFISIIAGFFSRIFIELYDMRG